MTSAQPSANQTTRVGILTVDDDPSVSRAVARDLRRRYGKDYRIIRAESGPQALDTQAAITAINVVDLDYYLLKPWDPPEEKFYPVIDNELDRWRHSDHTPRPQTKVVTTRWSARCSEVKDFLARNQLPFRAYLSDDPEGERLLAAAGVSATQLPVVITAGGQVLVEPSDSELAGQVGLTTIPAKDFYDIIVVGAGPAGLGAAVYGASEGLRTVLVERLATGGQAGQSSRIENCTLFLFEKLSDEQLHWLCQNGWVKVFEPGPIYPEGDPATCFYVLIRGTIALSRRVGPDDVETTRTSQPGAYAGAWRSYLVGRAPGTYNSGSRTAASSAPGTSRRRSCRPASTFPGWTRSPTRCPTARWTVRSSGCTTRLKPSC